MVLLLFSSCSSLLFGEVAGESGEFTPPYTEHGEDTNGNGLYENLVFNASLDITEAGDFNVRGTLYDSTFTTLITGVTIFKNLPLGTALIPLKFDGIDIYGKGIDGPYGVWLVLADKFWTTLDTDSAPSEAYNYTDFEHSPATFDPPHYDYGLDTDGNSLFNCLVTMVNLTVETDGSYTVEGDLLDGDSNWMTDNSNQSFFAVGNHTVELRFLGSKIRNHGKDGPYKVELDLKMDDSHLIDEDLHNTSGYLYTQFEGLAAYFTDPSSDQGIDLNSNGLFEYLRVSVGSAVNISADYRIVGDLWETAPAPEFLAATTNSTHLNQGTGTISVHFLGSHIYAAGIDDSYEADLQLFDSNAISLDMFAHFTANYKHDEFEHEPPILLKPPHDDYALDTDADSYYNYLVMNVSINASAAGRYRVNGTLYDAPRLTAITKTENMSDLVEGLNVVPLWFRGTDIYNSSKDGPYNVTIRLYDVYGNFLQKGYHNTSVYAYLDFEHEFIPDTTPPTISGVIASPDPQEVFGNVNVSASITDDISLDGSWIALTDPVGSPVGNYSLAYDSISGRFYHDSAYSMVGTYSYTIWARDTSNNWNSHSSMFTIRDTTSPTISSVLATPSPQEVHGLVNISATINDNYQLVDASVEITDPGGSPAGNYSMAYDTGFGRYFHEDSYSQLGSYSFTIWARDSSDNWNSVAGSFTMVDTTAPNIQSVTADPDPQVLHGSVNVSAIITDNYMMSTVRIRVTDPDTIEIVNALMPYDVGTGRYCYEDNYHKEGIFDFQITANDTSGSSNTYNGQFTIQVQIVDQWPPEISQVQATPSPQETGGSVNISAVVTDDVSVFGVWLEVFDPTPALIGNYSMMYDALSGRHYLKSAYDLLGTYSFMIAANDTSGKWNSTSGNFLIIDSTPPLVSDLLVVPSPQEVFGWVEISANVTDNYQLAGAYISITDPSSVPMGNFTMVYDPGRGRYLFNRTYDQIGTYELVIWAIDSSDNFRMFSGQFVIVDTTKPVVSGVSTVPPVQQPSGSVNISAQINDNYNLSGVWIDIRDPNSTPLGNFTMDYDLSQSRFYRNETYSMLGVYSFCIWANDSSNNWNSFCNNFAIQDQQPPLIGSVLADPPIQEVFGFVNVSAAVFDINLPLSVLVRITDPLGSLVGNYSMLHDPLNNRYFHNASYDTLGMYSFTIWAGDSTNNWSSSSGQFSIEDGVPPIISDVKAEPPIQEVHQSVRISAIVTDNYLLASVLIETFDPTNISLGTFSMTYDGGSGRYYYETPYDELGTYSFCIRTNDTSDNWMSRWGEFTVNDTLSPSITNAGVVPSPQEVFELVRIFAEVQDNYLLSSVRVNVTNPSGTSSVNFTMVFDSGHYQVQIGFAELGEHSYVIYAVDSSGNWASVGGVFEIRDTTLPVSDAGPDQEVPVGGTVTFDGSGSTDNYGISSYVWSFNDGVGSIVLQGVDPQHLFEVAGNYLVVLTVSDTSGNIDQDTMTVIVQAEKVPSAPIDLIVKEVAETYIILEWIAPTTNTDGSDLIDLEGYNVYRSSSPGGPYTKVGTVLAFGEFFREDGLTGGFEGYYVVTAVNSQGYESDHSNEIFARIPEKGKVTGSITDQEGNPVPGARTVLWKNGVLQRYDYSSTNGSFTLSDIDDGTYQLEITMDGYQPATREVVISSDTTLELGTIVLEEVPEQRQDEFPVWMIVLIVLIAVLVPAVIVAFVLLRRRSRKKAEE